MMSIANLLRGGCLLGATLGVADLLATTAHAADDDSSKYQIVIVGGGSGGVTTAAQIRRRIKNADVAIIEPADVHYYQPLWTMVGGGLFKSADSAKPMAAVIPKGCVWLKDAVTSFDPESNSVTLKSGKTVRYEQLVVAAGLQVDFDAVKGLPESLGKNGVCSIYAADQADYVWQAVRSTTDGLALFTSPKTGGAASIKCAGAPLKIMFLAEDHWRDQGRRDEAGGVRVAFAPAGAAMFGIKHYADALDAIRQRKHIDALFGHELVEVRGDAKQAVFRTATGEQHTVAFSLLHVTPPMSAPDFLKRSRIVDANGYVDVDKHTLRHRVYPNVWSLGDCCNAPTSKTAAAIASQAPVLVQNIQRVLMNQEPVAQYDGYASCPLITGKNSLMLIEFTYGGTPVSSFPGDNRVPGYLFFLMKKYAFPFAYWQLMLKGYWYGRHHLFEPKYF